MDNVQKNSFPYYNGTSSETFKLQSYFYSIISHRNNDMKILEGKQHDRLAKPADDLLMA
jgi:hypothetical protein